MDLAKPSKELTTFMRKFFKVFEKSAPEFNDLKDKKKIEEVFRKIKEPINEFFVKSEVLEKKMEHQYIRMYNFYLFHIFQLYIFQKGMLYKEKMI